MSAPLLTTKLYIPSPRPVQRLAPRLRLTCRLDKGLHMDHKLTLVSAPAGFGKTTLVSEWVHRVKLPVAWLSLDKSDNDTTRFLAYIVAALQAIQADFGETVAALLESPQMTTRSSLLENLITLLINDLATLPARILLILDDYHVINNLDIHTALAFLLDNLPPQVHLVVVSREDPVLPLHRLRAGGQMTEMRAQTYGGAGKDNGWAILETKDDGFLICGFTSSFGAGGMDVYLVRTDAQGNLLWERTFGGPRSEYGWAMAPTSDGGYVLAGQTESFGEGDKDGYLVKVNADGEEIWTQTFGGPKGDRLYSIDQGADGGFVLVGTTTSFGAGGRDAYLVKTDSAGKLAWMQVFGEDRDDVGHSVRHAPGHADGGYIVTGYTGSFGAKSYDTWLIKTDEAGDRQWQQFYRGERDDRTIYGEQTDDGGYILVGYTKSFEAVGWDVFLVRTDLSGKVIWHKTFGGNTEDTGYTVRQTSDKGFILTGETYSFGGGGGDMYVIKVDRYGEMVE